MKVKRYIHLDLLGEGFGFTEPEEGETLIGVPSGMIGDNSMPFIEHIKNGMITKTVNAFDLSTIEFETT